MLPSARSASRNPNAVTGDPAVRILALSWLISIPSLVISASMQGLSLARPSMLLTMLRQAVLPVLLAFILQMTGNLNMVWLSFAIAEALSVPAAIRLWINKSAMLPKPEPEEPISSDSLCPLPETHAQAVSSGHPLS